LFDVRGLLAVQHLDPGRQVARRRQLAHDAFDFALRSVAHPRQQLALIVGREMRPDQQDTGQMDRSFREHLEQHRKLSRQPRRATAPLGLVLRHAQLVDTIRVQGGASALAVDAARFDLAQVCEQLGRERVRTANEA